MMMCLLLKVCAGLRRWWRFVAELCLLRALGYLLMVLDACG